MVIEREATPRFNIPEPTTARRSSRVWEGSGKKVAGCAAYVAISATGREAERKHPVAQQLIVSRQTVTVILASDVVP